MNRHLAAILVLLLLVPSALAADRLIFRDGRTLDGRIVSQNASAVSIRTANGPREIPKLELREIQYSASEAAAAIDARRQAEERAERERAARERAEQERQARERAERERQARENAERERREREREEQVQEREATLRELEGRNEEADAELELLRARVRERQREADEERERFEEARSAVAIPVLVVMNDGRELRARVLGSGEDSQVLALTEGGVRELNRDDISEIRVDHERLLAWLPDKGQDGEVVMSSGQGFAGELSISPDGLPVLQAGDSTIALLPMDLPDHAADDSGRTSLVGSDLQAGQRARVLLKSGLIVEGTVLQINRHDVLLDSSSGRLLFQDRHILDIRQL